MKHHARVLSSTLALGLAAALPVAAHAAAAAPDKLTILFGDGSATISPSGVATLDQASRLYRAGNPIVMIVTGTTDATGNPAGNLKLSERRAQAVLTGLVERGGSTDPAVNGPAGTPEPDNRRVDINWR